MISVLFVCMGNICRSPAAEGAFIRAVEDAGLRDVFYIESAGTISHHQGELPDPRMIKQASVRGLDLSTRSRPFRSPEDFEKFDYILVMDMVNHRDITGLEGASDYSDKIHLMMDFAPKDSPNNFPREVPDPYYGGIEGFDTVLDMVEESAVGLLSSIKKNRL